MPMLTLGPGAGLAGFFVMAITSNLCNAASDVSIDGQWNERPAVATDCTGPLA